MPTLAERARARYAYSGRNSEDEDEDTSDEDEAQTPTHPISSMQGPFEESIEDAALPETTSRPDRLRKLGAKARRARLLDTNQAIDTYNAKWRSTPEARYHPLTKILAQIAFGVHLLHQQLAKSDEEVVKILQRHVDEVDHFVATTEEDLDLALADIKERINYLKLPLEHVNIFDAMLDDRQFRTSIIEGNDRIEQVVNRTGTLMNDLYVDIKKALESTADMARYLERIAGDWPEDDAGSIEIYHTMQANAEGWLQCLGTLQMKGNSLGVAIAQLGRILNEMSKRAGVASRRSLAPGRPKDSESHRSSHTSPRGSTTSRKAHRDDRIRSPAPLSRYSKREMKALPEDPDMVTRAVEATLPRQEKEEKPRSHRYEEPRQTPASPVVTRKPISEQNSPKPKSRAKKSPPAPIKTSEKFGNFMRSATASASALSPRLLSPKFPKDEKSEPKGVCLQDSRSDGKPETKPQSTLKRARSKLLKRKSVGSLGEKFKAQQKEDQKNIGSTTLAELSGISSGGADSAYSSGTDADKRPNTSPGPSLRPPANFALFPSTTTSLAPSISSPRSISSNHDTDKESVIMALPPMPQKPIMEPSPLRRGSTPGPGLKKKGSLTSLFRFFKRQKSEKPGGLPAALSVTSPIYELA